MTAPAATPEAAYAALAAWWAEAGVDAPPPPAAPRTSARAPTAAPARKTASSAPPKARPPAAPPPRAPRHQDILDDARAIAAKCATLDDLKAALDAFDRHPLRHGARNTVFARGNPDAPVMIVGEAPGAEEDRAGLPFVGRSGKLMDRVFAAAGLTDEAGLYITNVVNWRPRGNRNPNAEEVELCRPFIERHVALKNPKILVFAGAIAAQTLTGATQGITRLRGRWLDYAVKDAGGATVATIPALPIYHPAYLLRRPIGKRETWKDVLSLMERLEGL